RTLTEGSVELRHPITEKLGAAVFVDGGQVSRQSFGPFRYGAGFGMRYRSPVGPLRVDLGFPFQPPDGDQRWQVHVSLGSKF
ncbi:MAG: outer membrane protein assembly factor, partial [Deltaproteobacteria bacterium]